MLRIWLQGIALGLVGLVVTTAQAQPNPNDPDKKPSDPRQTQPSNPNTNPRTDSLFGTNGLALIRAIDCRTFSLRSGRASADHPGFISVSSWMDFLNSVVGEGEHSAVGVVDEDDLLGTEQPLADGQRANLVVGDHSSGVADDVRLALVRPRMR